MAYNRIVTWPSPVEDQNMSLGLTGFSYTKIITDVPTVEFSREIWEDYTVFPIGGIGQAGKRVAFLPLPRPGCVR